jgi:hypothetical protein
MAGLRGLATGVLALVAWETAVTEAERGNNRLGTLIEAPTAALRAFMSASRPGIPDTTGGGGDAKPQTLAPRQFDMTPSVLQNTSMPGLHTPRSA